MKREKKEITCIVCPVGCLMEVIMEDGKVVEVWVMNVGGVLITPTKRLQCPSGPWPLL